MRQKTVPQMSSGEKTIKDIRRATRKHYSAEDYPSSYKLRLTSLLKIGVFGSVCGLI